MWCGVLQVAGGGKGRGVKRGAGGRTAAGPKAKKAKRGAPAAAGQPEWEEPEWRLEPCANGFNPVAGLNPDRASTLRVVCGMPDLVGGSAAATIRSVVDRWERCRPAVNG